MERRSQGCEVGQGSHAETEAETEYEDLIDGNLC